MSLGYQSMRPERFSKTLALPESSGVTVLSPTLFPKVTSSKFLYLREQHLAPVTPSLSSSPEAQSS